MLNDGDWVEGEPKWWWKYVFRAKIRFWNLTLNEKLAKDKKVQYPDPGLGTATASLLITVSING